MMNDDESNLPANRLWQPTTAKWFAVVFGGSVLYAIIRYHDRSASLHGAFQFCFQGNGQFLDGCFCFISFRLGGFRLLITSAVHGQHRKTKTQ